jgi:hypothetical protein
MTITTIKPPPIKPIRLQTPQCCAIIPANTQFEDWRKGRYAKLRPHMDAARCQRESTVEINGSHYCRAHAGGMALEMWLSNQLVEK